MLNNSTFEKFEENTKFELLMNDSKKLSISLKNYTEDIRKSLNISENLKQNIDDWKKLNNTILNKIKK